MRQFYLHCSVDLGDDTRTVLSIKLAISFCTVIEPPPPLLPNPDAYLSYWRLLLNVVRTKQISMAWDM